MLAARMCGEQMELNKIIDKLERIFPLSLKEEWDNCGLAVGELSADVKKIMISLDVTDNVIKRAVETKCDMIISHHPVIFKSIQSITSKTITGKRLLKLIKGNIALYTAHTNADAAIDGLNDYIAKRLGAKTTKVADSKYHDTVKLVFFVPETHFEAVKNKLIKINKFSYNGYSGVTYSTEVWETFIKDSEKSTTNEKESINQNGNMKIEAVVYRKQLKEIIGEIEKTHPYEEPAYEVTEMDQRFQAGGIGRIYELANAEDVEVYFDKIKKSLNLKSIKTVYNKGMKIKKIGIVNGSGMSFMKKMRENNVDLFITADIKYHEALEAKEYGVALADIGHYESECYFGEMVKEKIVELGIEVEVFNDDPVFQLV